MKNLYRLKKPLTFAALFGCFSSPVFGQLYPFEEHTFTNAGAEGKNGPLLGACTAEYAAAAWTADPAFFNMTTQGIQEWTVPYTGDFHIEAYGAQGGDDTYTANPEAGGLGAKMTGDFSLVEGQVLYILVGQRGENTRVTTEDNAAAGGGGGTFVWDPAAATNPLIAAGGGAGGAGFDYAERNATSAVNGQNSASTVNGGISGNGGRSNSGGSSYWAGGGAGWLTNGTGGNVATDYVYTGSYAQGGRRPLEGGIGGTRYTDGLDEGGDGGFGGGGGGGSDNMGTGGGGGYSGGGGQNGNLFPSMSSGGGGGSYNSGANQVNESAFNAGHGYVVISGLCVPLTITASEEFICQGDELTITAVSESGAFIIWEDGIINGEPFIPEGIGLVTFNGVSSDGEDCAASISVTIFPIPVVVAHVDPAVPCAGEEMTLYGTGGYTYEWIPADIEDDEPFIAVEGVHTAILIGENYIGCSNSDTITYEVFPAPAIVATADDETICFGETVTLTGTGGETYDWSPVSVENGVPFTPGTVGTTTYTVIGTDDNGCTAESSIDVTMNSEMSSASTTVTEVAGADGSIDLTPSGGTPGYTFDWDNDGTGDFDDPEDLTGIAGGVYTVVIKDSFGCTVEETVTVDSQLGIDAAQSNGVSIYPNPTTSILTINATGSFNYTVIALNGEVVTNGNGNASVTISFDEMAAGTYMIKIETSNGVVYQKVVKE